MPTTVSKSNSAKDSGAHAIINTRIVAGGSRSPVKKVIHDSLQEACSRINMLYMQVMALHKNVLQVC